MITAEKVAGALRRIADRLGEHDILTQEGAGVLRDRAAQVRKGKDSLTWNITIDHGRPLVFSRIFDKNGREATPSIVVAIETAEAKDGTSSFRRLDMALEVRDLTGESIARWHLDLANEKSGGMQDGPLYHLQYGGHNPDARHLDHPLKGPRWCHPPMEVGLFCETVAANFYVDAWLRLRDDGGWCESVRTLQKLCYQSYIDRMLQSLNTSRSTALADMWADRWVTP